MTKPRTGSDSGEQRSAEPYILAAVGERFGVELEKKSIVLDGDSQAMEIDGYAPDPLILCEAWARIGPAKPGQQKKVMTDALKLVVARAELGGAEDCHAVLAFCDEDAAAHFSGKSWMAEALRQLNIEVLVVEIPPEVRESITAAQRRQAANMSPPQRG